MQELEPWVINLIIAGIIVLSMAVGCHWGRHSLRYELAREGYVVSCANLALGPGEGRLTIDGHGCGE